MAAGTAVFDSAQRRTMVIKVVTDSTCDLPDSVLEEKGIAMVPATVVYKGRAYRDRVDISCDRIFEILRAGGEVPTTAAPPPAHFSQVYGQFAGDGDGIISLHVTSEHSGIFDSALRGSENVGKACKICVVDTRQVSMGIGLLALDAAEAAAQGASLDEIMALVQRNIPRVRIFGAFDTMRYLALGGRINRALGNVGTVLKIRPLLTAKSGRIVRAGLARTYAGAIDRVVSMTLEAGEIEEWSVVYSTDRDVADEVAARLGRVCPPGRVPVARLGPALGIHGGPGAILVAAKLSRSGL